MALGILAIIAFNLIPLVWGVLASFKPVSQLVTYPPQLLGFDVTTENYRNVVAGGFMTGGEEQCALCPCRRGLGISLGAFAA